MPAVTPKRRLDVNGTPDLWRRVAERVARWMDSAPEAVSGRFWTAEGAVRCVVCSLPAATVGVVGWVFYRTEAGAGVAADDLSAVLAAPVADDELWYGTCWGCKSAAAEMRDAISAEVRRLGALIASGRN